MSNFRLKGLVLTSAVSVAVLLTPILAHADSFGGTSSTPGTFNLQVTPSPLVATIKPGVKTTVQLKIRNAGTSTENLRIDPKSFKISSDSTDINLENAAPPDIDNWVSFANQTFSIAPGQWYAESVTLKAPPAAGFSYSFAIEISRQKVLGAPSSGQAISGSVAIFTLINVDRPGAKSELGVDAFTTDKKVYEYLPATLSIRFRNDGNTIAQPSGNIFVQRGASAKTAMATLTVNPKGSYILPGTTRTLNATWSDGFPVYKSSTDGNGKTTQKLVWNWANLSHLRIGRYTATLVAVYGDNGRDVPIQGTVTFWVIPWKILLALLLVILLVLFALFMIGRFIYKLIRRGRKSAKKQPKKPAETQPPDTKDE